MTTVPEPTRCGRLRRDGGVCRNRTQTGAACWRHAWTDADLDAAAITAASLADLGAKRAPIDWPSLDAAWGGDDDD